MFLNSFQLWLIVSTLHYGKCLSDYKCVLPPYPENGRWRMAGEDWASPGRTFPGFVLKFTCNEGYQLDNEQNVVVYCLEGKWQFDIPKCVVSCRLNPHHSVEHRCLEKRLNGEEVYIDCEDNLPLGAVVYPQCKRPYFYSPVPLPPMRCLEEGWDSYAICAPDCGLISQSTKLILDGGSVREALPWQAAIYRKTATSQDYQQICGGSLVSSTIVISAAHCFWSEIDKQLPASEFAVAVGKQYRSWDHPNDKNAQKAIVSEIRLPMRFKGALTDYQDDIAVVKVNSMFHFTPYVRPVCLDFDYELERQQLKHGHYGKVAGWSLYKDNYSEKNSSLEVLNMPYVDIEACFRQSPESFVEMITSDKICSEYINGAGIRRGDSGAGLAFLNQDKGKDRYYLRGVASTAPRQGDGEPADHTPITFTQISTHEHFIKKYL